MYVYNIQLFVSISEHIMFRSVDIISDLKKYTNVQCVSNIFRTYNNRGVVIKIIDMDVQFKPLKSDINKMDISLNIVSNDEHVPPV